MTSKNEHTKDKQQTKPASDAYREGYDRIFCKHPNKIWMRETDDDGYYYCPHCGRLVE